MRVGCQYSVSRRAFVFVEEAAEAVASPDLASRGPSGGERGRHGLRSFESETAVGPVDVVMADVLVQHGLELAPADDQDPVEALPSEGADPAFADRVGHGCPHGGLDHPEAFRTEHRVERPGEECVPVVDQKRARRRGI